MATTNRRGAAIGACMFAGASLYMLWAAVTRSPTFRGPPALGYVGACLFALFAVRCTHVARGPECDDAARTSPVDRVVGVVELSSYLVAAAAGLVWLIRRLLGSAEPPNELERSGLGVAAAVAGLVVLGLAGTALRRARHDSAGAGAEPRRDE